MMGRIPFALASASASASAKVTSKLAVASKPAADDHKVQQKDALNK